MVDQKTPYLNLPLPHTDNSLDQDCSRIRQSLTALDSHAQSADAALAAHDERLNSAAANLAGESQAREQGDAAQSAALAALRQELAALAATVAAIKVDPWDVFPMRVPIPVEGVTFPELEETRLVLDEAGQPVQGEDGEPLTETVTVQSRHPIMPGETEPRENWLICDGGDDGQGGTMPDLRGRMILGASESRPAGESGGSETHTHSLSGTVGATTLTTAQMPRHAHQQSFSNGWGEGADGSIRMHVSSGPGSTSTQPAGQGQSHSHSLAADADAASNMPPYYAATYIMRCA